MIPQRRSVAMDANSSPANMQVTRDPRLSSSECAEIRGKTSEDSTGAENLDKTLFSEGEAEEKGEQEQGDGGDDGGDEDLDGEFEFTFACANPEGSTVAADAIFENGRIRPVYPLFDRKLLFAAGDGGSPPPPQSPLRKVFVQRRGLSSSSSSSSDEGDEVAGLPEGTYCDWRGKTVEEGEEASPEGCRKSNSTGFSKLWRFRELGRRSSSDGKDAFVFLNPRRRGKEEGEKEAATTSKGGKKGPAATAGVANEKKYVKPRVTREGERRKSYLPYKQAGFFTNVNGMSRNVHPF